MKENIFSAEKMVKSKEIWKNKSTRQNDRSEIFYANETKFNEAIFYFRNTPKNYILKLKLKQMAKIQRKSSDGIFNIRQNIILGKKH